MQTQLRENVEKVEQDLYGKVEGLQEELKDRIQGMETTFNQNENKWNDLEQNFGLEMEAKKQGLYEKIDEKNQEIEGFVQTKFQDWNDTENKINVHLENQKEIVTQDFFQYQENFNQKTKQFKDVIEKELQQGYKFLEENRQDLIIKFSTERDCVRKELGNVAKDFAKAREEVHALAEISEQKLFEEIRIRIQDEMKYLDQDISSGIEEMKQRISDGTGNIEKIAESLNDRCEHIEHGLLAKIEESEGFYTELFGDLRSKQEGLIKLDEEWKQGFEDLKVKLEDDMGHAIERWHENSDKNFNQEIADGRLRYKEGLDQVVVDLNQSVDLSIDKLGNLETILDGYRDGLEDRKRDQDLYIESYISGWTTEFETEKVTFIQKDFDVDMEENQMADAITEFAENDNEGQGENPGLSDDSELKDMILKLTTERDELEDRYLRKQADFENYRKRMTKEKQDAIQYANTELMRLLLDVLDNLERAKEASCNESVDIETVKKGVELISQTLYSTLSSRGLSRIEALGKAFDPGCHQAISSIEDSNVSESTITEEYQSGYCLFDRVLRPTMVRVSVPLAKSAQNGILEGVSENKDNEI
ncbi:hypothetical protein KUCAC02_007003 [Chaenocephalus aceratus]|nr:hypothetical protein KUCAC02_007003 [Chaenocephalus aceratus]